MSNYWQDRLTSSIQTITDRGIASTTKQIEKYYIKTQKSVIADFESLYTRITEKLINGEQVLASDLYKMDRYWQMQNQVTEKLRSMGNKEAATMSENFRKVWQSVYDSISLPSSSAYTTISNTTIDQMINQIWAADGKSWSERIWSNNAMLQQELNDKLLDCAIRGKTTKDLIFSLEERFAVSNYRARCLVNTELAHIETQASAQKYKDCGIEKYIVLSNTDDNDCTKFNGQEFKLVDAIVGENMPPFHPNCRCCIAPVVNV